MKLDRDKCTDAISSRLVYKAVKGGWQAQDCLDLVDYHLTDEEYVAACAELAHDGKMPTMAEFMRAFVDAMGEAAKK